MTTTVTNSGIYAGVVTHRRLRPRAHGFRYHVFSMLLDLDEIPVLDRNSRLFGHNRARVLSFRDCDHGDGRIGGLRAWVEDKLRSAGIVVDNPRIEVLCYPRLFGYVFNPLSVYFCHDARGDLLAILYEVANTFAERHTYVIPATGPVTERVSQACDKQFYVSPFLPMDCGYRFGVDLPGERVSIRIDESDPEGLVLVAAFSGKRRAISERALLGALAGHPLMTLKVTIGIHWQALRLWLKGVPVHRHIRAAEQNGFSVVAPMGRSAGVREAGM